MTKETLLKIIDEHIRARTPYIKGSQDCEWFVRKLYRLDGIELHPNIYTAGEDFVLVHGKAQLMDAVVFKNEHEENGQIIKTKHLGVMIDDRWFTQFSEATGIAKCEITRPVWEKNLSHIARHKRYAN